MKKIDYKIWFAISPSKFGNTNYYFVPEGILINGYDSKCEFLSKIDRNIDIYSKIMNYDINPMFDALQQDKPLTMILEGISYLAWLRKALFDRKYHQVNHGLKFVIGYLKHALAII